MKIAFIFFPNYTLLDVVGTYDPLWRLKSLGIIPDLDIHYHSFHDDCWEPYGFTAPPLRKRESLAGYDVLFVPGGMGTRPLRYDEAFLNWLRTGQDIPLITSVCTGALLLGAAGMLAGHRATTHYNEYDSLREFLPTDAVVEDVELLDDDKLITAGAVASSIALGLHLCERMAGEVARNAVKRSMGLSGKEGY